MAVRERVDGQIRLCQASNICAEGIFLAHVQDVEPPKSRKCWLEFSLPNCPEILIAARAVLLRQSTYAQFVLSALHFAAIAPSHRRMIQRYVQGPHLAAPAPAFLPHEVRG